MLKAYYTNGSREKSINGCGRLDTPVLLFVLPGNHLCPVDALRLPDDANSVLRVVQVVQQHTYHVVPVFRALVGPRSFLIPGSHSTHY